MYIFNYSVFNPEDPGSFNHQHGTFTGIEDMDIYTCYHINTYLCRFKYVDKNKYNCLYIYNYIHI
jgi:hypothetical protein